MRPVLVVQVVTESRAEQVDEVPALGLRERRGECGHLRPGQAGADPICQLAVGETGDGGAQVPRTPGELAGGGAVAAAILPVAGRAVRSVQSLAARDRLRR